MNGLNFNTRGDGKVLGEPIFEKEKRRLERRAEVKRTVGDEESEDGTGYVASDWN